MASAEAIGIPPGSENFGNPPVDVSGLYVPTTAYVVTGLQQDTRIRFRDGKVVPTIVTTFIVPGYPGVFTVRIDNYAFTYADPIADLLDRSYRIRSLYALPGSLDTVEPPPPVDLGGGPV